MSTLGLSGTPDTDEGLLKRLFWPSIQNAQDADLAASRGFWVCLALALVSAPMNTSGETISIGVSIGGYLDLAVFLFYFLGAMGVRQASLVASASMFATYLLSSGLYFWLSATHFSLIRLIGIGLLLANLRAAILIRKWQQDPKRREEIEDLSIRYSSSWMDKIADRMPMKVWPVGRFLFYAIAVYLLPLEMFQFATLLLHHS